MEIIIILLLIMFNGILAMSEIAIVSARKSRLQQQANEGNKKAQSAFELSNSPNRFLSAVQIGITFIGIFAGAFGGETVARNLASLIKTMPQLAPYGDIIGLLTVVSLITYLSLVIGELVPKRIALNNPEEVAKLVAKPMNLLAKFTSPLVSILTFSTDWVLRILNIKPSNIPTITEEEVKLLMKEGARVGIFDLAETDIVERTLLLGEKTITSMMTPRKQIVWLNIDHSFENIRSRITRYPHSYFPVCKDSIDKVLGVIQTKDLLAEFLIEEKIDLSKSLHNSIFVPETMEALKVLELFKKTGIHIALIVDEYGSVIGLISLSDILEEIVGDIPTVNELVEQDIMQREDGSYLVDGMLPIDDFKEFFEVRKLPGDNSPAFYTIGGLMMDVIGRIPVSGDKCVLGPFNFEVMDMDGNRVDKIMVTRTK